MGKVVMPKNSALLNEIVAVLKIYYEENDWLENDIYKARLKQIIGAGQYTSSYTKKSQVTSYFGFTTWENFSDSRSRRRITSSGRKFYLNIINSNKTGIQEDLLVALEIIKFGRENYGCPDSDSDVEPPSLCIRAILDLTYITYSEFAFLLWRIADCQYNYNTAISEIKNSRMTNSLDVIEEAVKYKDAKPIMALIRWGFLCEDGRIGGNKQIVIAPEVLDKYKERLANLKIFNTEKVEQVPEFEIGFSSNEVDGIENYYDTVEAFHDKVINESVALDENSVILDELNNRNPEYINTQNGRKYKTDPRIIKAASIRSSHLCVVDNIHDTFPRDSNTFYVEGHHIIPMKAQKDFSINLDRIENIATLCPNCHRAIHYATAAYKRKILKIIYSDTKQTELENNGIIITLEELLNKYYK